MVRLILKSHINKKNDASELKTIISHKKKIIFSFFVVVVVILYKK